MRASGLLLFVSLLTAACQAPLAALLHGARESADHAATHPGSSDGHHLQAGGCVVPAQRPGSGRSEVVSYMAATRLAGWAVGTAEDGVVTVYVPDERPELAVQIRYALEVECGSRVSATTGPGFQGSKRVGTPSEPSRSAVLAGKRIRSHPSETQRRAAIRRYRPGPDT